jgi:peroxin-5
VSSLEANLAGAGVGQQEPGIFVDGNYPVAFEMNGIAAQANVMSGMPPSSMDMIWNNQHQAMPGFNLQAQAMMNQQRMMHQQHMMMQQNQALLMQEQQMHQQRAFLERQMQSERDQLDQHRQQMELMSIRETQPNLNEQTERPINELHESERVIQNLSHDEGMGTLESFWEQMNRETEVYAEMSKSNSETLTQGDYDNAWKSVAARLEEDHNYQAVVPLEQNRYKDIDNSFEDGMRLYAEGQVQDALEAFEASIAKDPLNDEGWRMLGVCHAENDEDKKAIQCFVKCLECDPYNLDALLAMGTSYVNEMDSVKALETLRSWVTHNPVFHGLTITPDEYTDGSLMDEVIQLMVAASNHLSNKSDEGDVMTVLGVLYNVSQDFNSAIECFQRALSARPNDYSLLNKIGATLANSDRSQDAMNPYARALQARPKYTRGWLNIGISYANMDQYMNAAKAYVHAIKLNPRATHIWGYLRVVLNCLDRLDLVELTKNQNISDIENFVGSAEGLI